MILTPSGTPLRQSIPESQLMSTHRFSLFLLPSLLLVACQSAGEESALSNADKESGWFDSETPSAPKETASFDAPFVSSKTTPEYQEPSPSPKPTGKHAEEKAEIMRKNEKRRQLATVFLAQADEAFGRGDYKGAISLYSDAMELDMTNRAARDGIRRCESALSGEAWDVSSAEDVLAQEQIRRAYARVKIEGLVQDGDNAMDKKDYEAALAYYQSAEMALRTRPGLAGQGLEHSVVSAKLESATIAFNDALDSERQSEAAAAKEEAAAAESARLNYTTNRIQTLFQEANSAFSRGFYEESVGTLDAVLELDPDNQDARELLQVANMAWLATRKRNTDTAFREQWKATFDELTTLAIPPKSAIEHDVEYWRKTVLKRGSLDKIVSAAEVDPTEANIQSVLDSTRIEPRFDNSIEEIADNLATYTRVNFVVSRAVREDLDEDVKTISMAYSRQMPVSQILSIIENLSQNQIQFVIRNGVVNVLSAEESTGANVLNKYEVRDIVRPIQDFVGVDINLAPSGGIEEVDEELPEREATILTEDDLLATITENIEPDIWDDTATVAIENGTLIVNAQLSVQERINSLLEDLRKSSHVMVELKVRFLKVEDSFLQDVGVDFRGLGDDATSGLPGKGSDYVFDDFGSDPGSPGLPGTLGTGNDAGLYFREASDNVNILARTENLYDSGLGNEDGLIGSGGLSLQYTFLDDAEVEAVLRAVEKSERREVLTEPTLMVSNTQRATSTFANQVSYVGDFDVEIAQAASIADPIVRVARDGVYLDVRPVVSADRRFIYVDVRPTVATLVRPIPSFQTSLGTGSPVTMQLPEMELQKIRTRVLIPDGGTLLLGGMKVVSQQALESGIPILSRIPVLSFFFSRKGEYESYQKLLILLTAQVIIPDEFEPSSLPGGAAR